MVLPPNVSPLSKRERAKTMTDSHLPASVAVIGAGIFGVSTAVHLARLGVPTTLLNDGPIMNGASGRSLAWLNSARRRSSQYHYLRLLGMERYRMLALQNPGLHWLKFGGGLTWDADDDGNEIEDVFAFERARGYQSMHLDRTQVSSITPGIDSNAITRQGAIFNPAEGWVDLPSLCRHLLDEFENLGGVLRPEVGNCVVAVEDGRVAGVSAMEAGFVAADAVLVAAGPQVPAMAAALGQKIADATPISMLVITEPVSHSLKAVLNTPRVALRPAPDGKLALDSAWSEEEIFIDDHGSYQIDQGTVDQLLREASAVLEGNPVLQAKSVHIGPKPIPGDGEPVFGELDTVRGCYVAFSHSGATLGLIAGELLAEEIATGKPNPVLEQFRPGRFSA